VGVYRVGPFTALCSGDIISETFPRPRGRPRPRRGTSERFRASA